MQVGGLCIRDMLGIYGDNGQLDGNYSLGLSGFRVNFREKNPFAVPPRNFCEIMSSHTGGPSKEIFLEGLLDQCAHF